MVVAHRRGKIAALIGFAVVCILIFVVLFQKAGGSLSLSSTYNVNAILPSTFNLVPDSDVRSSGVTVGVVKSVLPDGANAKVNFQITTNNKSFKTLYANATDQIRTKTLVGESYLSITPGTPSAPAIKSGGTLPVSRNLSAVPLQDVLNMFTPATRAGIEGDMKGLGNGLNGHGAQLNNLFGELNPAVDNGNQLMEILNPERTELAGLIDDTGQVLNALGQRTAQFQELISDAKTTATAVASRASNLKSTLANLPSTLSVAKTAVSNLNGFSTSATPVFSELRSASTKLSPAIQQLEPTAVDAQQLFRRLKPFLARFQPLVTELTPGANSVKTLAGPLDAVLRQADPALEYLKPYGADMSAFFSNVGGIVNDADGLGDRGAVYPMVGYQDFADITPTEQTLLNAMIKAGTLGILTGDESNPYPEPGTAGTPSTQQNYALVKEMP